MTALVLAWRRPTPGVQTRWRGPDATIAATAAASDPQPIAAVIGPPGPAGPPLATYEHVQAVATALWTVNHNLGRFPSGVTVVSVGGVEVAAGVTHASTALSLIDFAAPFAGRARII